MGSQVLDCEFDGAEGILEHCMALSPNFWPVPGDSARSSSTVGLPG